MVFPRKIQSILERIGIRKFIGTAKIRAQYLSAVRDWKSWLLVSVRTFAMYMSLIDVVTPSGN